MLFSLSLPLSLSLSLSLQDKDMELCAANLKVEQLDAELLDLSSQESKDEASLSKIKKQLRDLEAKVKDQEEELDEQAGTIQVLEQVGQKCVCLCVCVCCANRLHPCRWSNVSRDKFSIPKQLFDAQHFRKRYGEERGV